MCIIVVAEPRRMCALFDSNYRSHEHSTWSKVAAAATHRFISHRSLNPMHRRVQSKCFVARIGSGVNNAKKPFFQKLDIRLKWPNDIYAYGSTKLGGVVANTEISGTDATCNIGIGFNLDNRVPTTCLNELIKSFNTKHSTNLPYVGYEQFFANVFNEMENLIEMVQTGKMEQLFEIYYDYWLHTDAEIVIIDSKGKKKLATIIGVDDFGYLRVQQPGQAPESVHPDGNSFDILRGLISAKHF